MANTTLVKKLNIKAGYRMLLLNAPEGYAARLADLPPGVSIFTSVTAGTAYDLVQVFIRNISEVIG